MELLKSLAGKYGYEMVIVDKALDEAGKSSTYIREELARGILKGNELGYTYRIHGRVIHGRHLGTTLDFLRLISN
ncbi:MAG: hypothetical protein ACLUOI_07860 [Eisenbergiella sp.]